MAVGLEITSLIRTRRVSATSPRRGQVSGAMPMALRVRNFRRTATRMTVSIGVAVLVVIAPVVPVSTASASSSDVPPPDKTALIMGGTSIPTWNDADVEVIMNQFIAPTHPGQTIEPVALTTPEEGWPITGLIRLIGLALGPPSIFGPGGAAWPDEPWWKLSGLFDRDYEQSIQAGLTDLEKAMTKYGNDHLVIYGYSQGAMIAIREKRKLAEQYPATTAPDIDFVLSEDPNLPNGGILARFPGLYIPILGLSFNGAEPTNTPFHTDVITRQYDGLADFPLYPLNLIADLNAVLGVVYRHLYPFDVSLAPDPSTSTPVQDTHGDTSYYFFPTQDLPLFDPLRTLGVPESLIDVVEPFFRVLVELGYDRSIAPWQPTPARLIAMHDPMTVATDLVNAIGQGINNALAVIGLPPLLSIPAPVSTATAGPVDAPSATAAAKADITPQVTLTETPNQTGQVTSTGSATGTPQMSTDTATSTTNVTETDPATSTQTANETHQATSTAANASEDSTKPTQGLSATASTSKPAKPAGRPTPRPVVRDSLGVGQQLPDLPHHGNGDPPTTRTAAVGDGAATAGLSSAASSSTGSSPGGGSPGGTGDGS
jgi:hypothetical protein